MLELTVLLRYSKNGRRFCDILGVLKIDLELHKIIGDESTAILNCKYYDMKEIICNLFTSNKSLKSIFREIGKSGMKISESKFSDGKNKQIAILIED